MRASPGFFYRAKQRNRQSIRHVGGTLITFEGIDGSGKSTQARRLAERLEEQGRSVILVREPGGTPFSERVRTLLLESEEEMVPLAEVLLFSAARAQLCAERIGPALGAGEIVICDRFYDSTLAYQGAGREIEDEEWLRELSQRATGGLVPDRTYLVEVPLATALARRSVQADRMEGAGRAFYERVMRAYARQADREPDRFRVLDGTAAIETLHEVIWRDVQEQLANS